jgi:hypothetical protein
VLHCPKCDVCWLWHAVCDHFQGTLSKWLHLFISFSKLLKLAAKIVSANCWNYAQIAETIIKSIKLILLKLILLKLILLKVEKWQKLKISKNCCTSTNFPAKNTCTNVFGSFYCNSLLTGIILYYLPGWNCPNFLTRSTQPHIHLQGRCGSCWVPAPSGQSNWPGSTSTISVNNVKTHGATQRLVFWNFILFNFAGTFLELTENLGISSMELINHDSRSSLPDPTRWPNRIWQTFKTCYKEYR